MVSWPCFYWGVIYGIMAVFASGGIMAVFVSGSNIWYHGRVCIGE